MSQAELAWRCRRGRLELDLLLHGYLERVYPQAPPAEQARFRRLLDLPDPLLWRYLSGETPVEDAELAELLGKIRSALKARP